MAGEASRVLRAAVLDDEVVIAVTSEELAGLVAAINESVEAVWRPHA